MGTMVQNRQPKVLPLFAERHATISPRTFAAIPSSLKVGASSKAYGRHSANAEVLDEAMETFRVSKYQLSKLLGFSSPSNIYRWFDGTHRPSPLYLVRLLKLWSLYHSGVTLFRIRFVDWAGGKVYWRTGEVTVGLHLGGGRGGRSTNGPQPLSGRESEDMPESWGKTQRR